MLAKKLLRRIGSVLKNVIGFGFSLIVLVPFIMIVLNSFKVHAEANRMGLNLDGATWSQFIENYSFVIERSDFFSALFNSVFVTAISVTCIILISSMTSFVVVRRKLKFVNSMIIMGLTLPGLIVAVYFMMSTIGFTTGNGAFAGAILLYITGSFPLAYFIYTGFIKGVSPEIDEAAIIDGASPLKCFFLVIFPILKPVTITLIITTSMAIWNDFSVSLYFLNYPSRRTLVLSTYMFVSQNRTSWNHLFANVVLISIPIVLLYLILQRYIVSGLASGAVKG